MKSQAICVLALILGLTAVASRVAPLGQHREVFQPPKLTVDSDERIVPHLPWLTTEWNAKEDAPFLPVVDEVKPFRVFHGFDQSGTWPRKVEHAYNEWHSDCQNVVKLFRVSAYFGVLKEIDNGTARSKRFQQMWDEVHNGWLIIKQKPKSYWFVRQGYRACAADGDRHLFGDLPEKLLARNPLDRPVFCCAVEELWAEKPHWNEKLKVMKQVPGKGKEFEEFLLKVSGPIRKSEFWRPWDDTYMAEFYFAKAWRTRRRSDLQQAIQFNDAVLKVNPPEFGPKDSIVRYGKMLESMKQYMKYD